MAGRQPRGALLTVLTLPAQAFLPAGRTPEPPTVLTPVNGDTSTHVTPSTLPLTVAVPEVFTLWPFKKKTANPVLNQGTDRHSKKQVISAVTEKKPVSTQQL